MNRPTYKQHRMTDYELLQACIRSGQVEADQLNAHYVEGDLRRDDAEEDDSQRMLVTPFFWMALVILLAVWAAFIAVAVA